MGVEIFQADLAWAQVDAGNHEVSRAPALVGAPGDTLLKAVGAGLRRAGRRIRGCAVGEARLTDGYELPVRYVILGVCPVWKGGHHDETELLQSCYAESLRLAEEAGCRSIAVPMIATGPLDFPRETAAEIALRTAEESPPNVIFVAENSVTVRCLQGVAQRL